MGSGSKGDWFLTPTVLLVYGDLEAARQELIYLRVENGMQLVVPAQHLAATSFAATAFGPKQRHTSWNGTSAKPH